MAPSSPPETPLGGSTGPGGASPPPARGEVSTSAMGRSTASRRTAVEGAEPSSSRTAEATQTSVPCAGHAARRVLLVGEAPSPRARPEGYRPLCGRPAAAILRMLEGASVADQTEDAYEWLTRRFDVANLFRTYAEAFPWSAPRARDAAAELMLARAREVQEVSDINDVPYVRDVVVALGRRAGAALGVDPRAPWGSFTRFGLLRMAVIPHPSGLNRVLNSEGARENAAQTLRRAEALARGERS